ncbi:NAD-dependent epimerase/dehydratase family protein [Pseudomonas kitaguniensis]|uniref:NAD-dependent epimerase/dehydratase family protein n=1 Tax=Pseudomonas kitaguniensis TaxID=2607908 RepID=UPI003D05C1F2
MSNQKGVACVTGGTGMVGRKIVKRLLSEGYDVRVLTRGEHRDEPMLSYISGDISDQEILHRFLSGADLVFHCAAELHDVSMMRSTNVDATQRLLEACKPIPLKYFCFISSAGVIGLTDQIVVDEDTPCNPQNEYEITKSEAEKLVVRYKPGNNTVILRPTNVIDMDKPGVFSLVMQGGWVNRLKVFIKGGECAHLVHAQDVACAATFFIEHEFEKPECFFVSKDDDRLNTVAGVWDALRAAQSGARQGKKVLHLPYWLPRYLRKLSGRDSNSGNVIYSSEKLTEFGFTFIYGVRSMSQELVVKNG